MPSNGGAVLTWETVFIGTSRSGCCPGDGLPMCHCCKAMEGGKPWRSWQILGLITAGQSQDLTRSLTLKLLSGLPIAPTAQWDMGGGNKTRVI